MDLELLLATHADRMATAIPEAVRDAHSEEDIRHAINRLIDDFLVKADITVKGRHEYGLAGGFVDSKYGGVILEYKNSYGPDRLSPNLAAPGTRKAVEQIKSRFTDFHNAEGIAPNRLFAAGCDGKYLLFIRHRGGKFEIQPPQPVTPDTLKWLLRALVSLGAQGLSFTPEQLADKFGADSALAERGIANIYALITGTDNAKAKTFFSQWKMLFGEVCGYDVEGRNEKIQKLGQHYGVKRARPAELLFSVHTYYAIFMKFLAAEIAASFSPLGLSVLRQALASPTSEALRGEMRKLEQGGIWSQIGVSNFLEGDLFSWYLDAWDERAAEVVRALVGQLDRFDPTTLSVDPAESHDLLKRLYQNLFPKSVRHDLGEYYTPDWLAEHVLNELGYDGDPDQRLLDPACGSGTFLVMAINRVKQWFEDHRDSCGFGEAELVQKVLRNIVGFDLNPLAVMAARTNYLLAIRDLLRFAGQMELPVYLCDSIMTPVTYGGLASELGVLKELPTAVGTFHVPTEIARDRETLGRYTDALEFCILNDYGRSDFLQYCKNQGIAISHPDLHRALYGKVRKLNAGNRNGLWARIIKNAFAPLFVGKVDYVAGNPPWVNWESLPERYRKAHQKVWQAYGLFTLSGTAARLGGGKKDLSMLFVYACADHYLNTGGRLGFVITQSVFKTKGAGDGFRQFRFPSGGRYMWVKPLVVHDLSSMQVFEGATNRTAVFICEKTPEDFKYPVPYLQWRGRGRIGQDESLPHVLATTTREEMGAVPVEATAPNSPWLTAPKRALMALQKVIGKSPYRAYAGCCTWLNGVFWVRVLERLHNGDLLIENLHDVGKIPIKRVQVAVEPDLVYPLIRGRDVRRWHAEPHAYTILTQDPATRAGLPEGRMKLKYPKTFAYLKRFEEALKKRSGYRKYFDPSDPFYSMYNVGPYSMSPNKVAWCDMGTGVRAAAVTPAHDPATEGARLPIMGPHSMFIPTDSEVEARFIEAALNSTPAQLLIASYGIETGITTHVPEHVAIPRFEADNPLHQRLAELSRQCHEAAAREDTETLAVLEVQVDEAAAELWGLTAKELRAIQSALART